jgi:hypothetical protein
MSSDDNAAFFERCPVCRKPMQVVRLESGVPGLPPGVRRQMTVRSRTGTIVRALERSLSIEEANQLLKRLDESTNRNPGPKRNLEPGFLRWTIGERADLARYSYQSLITTEIPLDSAALI